MLDLLIKGARIVDGSGAAAYIADVGLSEGKIAAIGDLDDAEAGEIINAMGLVAAPGFIDMHSHSDDTLPINPRAESKIRQGVTTEVVGMCGGSPAPITEERRAEILRHADGYVKCLPWSWLSFGEYLDYLRGNGLSVNVVPMVGHGTIRVAAMGHSAEAPTPAQLDQMKALLAQAMDEGAWGFSTGLIYPPGFFSETEELVQLARVAAAAGGFYFSHIRGEGTTLLDAISEAIAIGERAELPVQTAHFKASGQSHWSKAARALEMLDAARARGVDITSDMYPYTASSTGLGALLPDWAHEGGRDALLERLRGSETRFRIRQGIVDGVDALGGRSQWAGTIISRCPSCPALEGKTIAELSEEAGKAPPDLVLDVLADSSANVSMIQFKMSEDNLRMQLEHDLMMIGSDGSSLSKVGPLSAGKPHPRNYGTFPRVLAKYVREEGVLSLEEGVRRMTGLPAHKLGLGDRGLLREGYWADMVLFDPEAIRDRATFADPHQYPEGIRHVIVNGQVTVALGEHRGTLAGRILAL